MNGLTETSNAWLASSSLEERKALGQYMTPGFIQEKLLQELLRLGVPANPKVLDPGVGTGEFLRSFAEKVPTAELHGWDQNKEILVWAEKQLKEIKQLAVLENVSALEQTKKPSVQESFDLVIGNPPYFQFKPSKSEKEYFSQVISGRTNIFALFFQVGIESLKTGGKLAYVVPPSMNTGSYFQGLREYLLKHASLEHLEIISAESGSFASTNAFADANTAAQIIILEKTTAKTSQKNQNFIFQKQTGKSQRIIFTEHKKEFQKNYKNKKTLQELGFYSETGSIVWNQHKEKLSSNPNDVLLIWSDNIKKEIVLDSQRKNPEKKQYIKLAQSDKILVGPALVVNRVVGSVGKGQLRAAFIEPGEKFVAENHVNVIRKQDSLEISRSQWQNLLAQLVSKETIANVQRLTGNSQISSSELNYLVPFNSLGS